MSRVYLLEYQYQKQYSYEYTYTQCVVPGKAQYINFVEQIFDLKDIILVSLQVLVFFQVSVSSRWSAGSRHCASLSTPRDLLSS